MKTTNELFTVVCKYAPGVFGVLENVIVEYDEYSTDPLDDRIRRIDTGVYLGSLIQNPEMMVYQPKKMEPDDDLKKLLEDYFSAYNPVILHVHTCITEMTVSTNYIRDILFKRWEYVDIISFHQIYSDNKEGTKPGIIRIPRGDFSLINIREYTELPALSTYLFSTLKHNTVYKYRGRGVITGFPRNDDTSCPIIGFQTIDGMIRFQLGCYNGFYPGSKEAISVGPQEYTIFFEIVMGDTDSIYAVVHSVLVPVTSRSGRTSPKSDEIIENIHNILRALNVVSQKTCLDRMSFSIETEKCVKFRDDGYTYIPVPIRNYDCDEVDYFHVDVVNTGYDPSNKLRCDLEIYPYSLENDTILNDRAEITIEGVDEERLERFLNPETFIDELISSAPKYFALEDENNE